MIPAYIIFFHTKNIENSDVRYMKEEILEVNEQYQRNVYLGSIFSKSQI